MDKKKSVINFLQFWILLHYEYAFLWAFCLIYEVINKKMTFFIA
jgi:hypothetical protein